MRIGVDFDNTIVCYDELFHRVAFEQKLIPPGLAVNKSEVRNHLRRSGQEPLWTEMQGLVYGSRMAEAAPFPGVVEFFQECREAGIQVSIISHKTRHPFLGERHDLHQAARDWLERQRFFDPAKIGLARDEVFFELTKEAKLRRIAERGCDYFIDDLPELLADPLFPKIERILFDPADLYVAETEFFRARSWAEIAERIAITHFAAAHGCKYPAPIARLSGGGNNRVYIVGEAGHAVVVKHYFRHRADTRDRFASERAFYEYLWQRGIRRTPQPLAWDAGKRLGLFSFEDGRKLQPGEIDAGSIDQALKFIIELNQERPTGIPLASEACFTLSEHVALIENRVLRLGQIEPSSEIDQRAVEFVKDFLQPAWSRIQTSICDQIETEHGLRVLSPSDFGFHNALLPPDGRLRFFDFEYAGWDDPAKLICDFFCQPQAPVPHVFWDHVTGTLADILDASENLPRRAQLLLPAYQIKWCCIMLNEFLGHDRDRRDFAQGAASSEPRKIAQLEKARSAFQTIRD